MLIVRSIRQLCFIIDGVQTHLKEGNQSGLRNFHRRYAKV